MSRIVCHRGFWWPRRGEQNRSSSVTKAFLQGWGVEIDVWGSYGDSLKVGHDHPEAQWTPSSEKCSWSLDAPIFLHMKMPKPVVDWQMNRIAGVLTKAHCLEQSYIFWSPDYTGPEVQFAEYGLKYLLPIDCRQALESAIKSEQSLSAISGFWLEQPDEDWVIETDIARIQAIGKTTWVLSSELHTRAVDLAAIQRWNKADGIVTDYPHLLSQILNDSNEIVHPIQPWWLEEKTCK